jgi:hypothetical protein
MQGPGSRARLPLVAPSTQDSVPNLQAARTVDVNHVDNNAAVSASPPTKKKNRKYRSKNVVDGRHGSATFRTSGYY